MSRRRIAVFESKRGDGTFPDSFCGVSVRLRCILKGKNGTKSWNTTASEDMIGSTERWRGQNKFHLGNVWLTAKEFSTLSDSDRFELRNLDP